MTMASPHHHQDGQMTFLLAETDVSHDQVGLKLLLDLLT